MLKLIKLEWKKNNILKYICKAVIITAVISIFIIAMCGELESEEIIGIYGKSMVNISVELFVHMSYMLCTGVMLAAFVVGAYKKGTINLMFSYPIKRRKILLSKISAVGIFNFTAMVLSKLIIYAVLLLTKPLTHVSATVIEFGELYFWLNIIVSSAVMVSITYIALLVGLRMKSSKATIVAAVIIICFTQGNIGEYTLVGSLPFYIVLIVLSAFSVFLSIYNVETKDVG